MGSVRFDGLPLGELVVELAELVELVGNLDGRLSS